MPKLSPKFIEKLMSDPGNAVCPNCQETGFWDNRKGKKPIGKGPTFTCKNKDGCDTGKGYPFGVFARDLPQGAGSGPSGAVKASWTWPQLRKAYAECMEYAVACAGNYMGKKGIEVNDAAIASMTATLFIARKDAGALPEAPKPKAPPPPEDEPDEEYNEDDPGNQDDDLPF